jgi:hypothetical protein
MNENAIGLKLGVLLNFGANLIKDGMEYTRFWREHAFSLAKCFRRVRGFKKGKDKTNSGLDHLTRNGRFPSSEADNEQLATKRG